MSDHEIVTQHFDDPIGSFMHVNGKCYVKVSNKTDTIDTPIDTSQTSVYYKDMSHCHDCNLYDGMFAHSSLLSIISTNGGFVIGGMSNDAEGIQWRDMLNTPHETRQGYLQDLQLGTEIVRFTGTWIYHTGGGSYGGLKKYLVNMIGMQRQYEYLGPAYGKSHSQNSTIKLVNCIAAPDNTEHGIMLCPPKNMLLLTVNLTESMAVMSFDIPSQSVPPTSVVYNPKPAGFSRVLARASAPHDTPYIFPTQERDVTGALREKIVLTRITTRATLSGESPATNDVISKMLHK